MKINDIFNQVNRLMRQDHQQPNKISAAADQQKNGDALEISPEVEKVKDLITETLQTPPQDAERIAAIKQEIARGTYQVDSKKLAEKMLTKN